MAFNQPPQMQGPVVDVQDINRRLRILEERYTNLRRTVQVNEQNVLSINKNILNEISTLRQELNTLKENMGLLQEKIEQIIDELQVSAKKTDVQILEKYINLWQPVKFVTEKDVERIVDRLLGSRKG